LLRVGQAVCRHQRRHAGEAGGIELAGEVGHNVSGGNYTAPRLGRG
jgi:hypothetical protein